MTSELVVTIARDVAVGALLYIAGRSLGPLIVRLWNGHDFSRKAPPPVYTPPPAPTMSGVPRAPRGSLASPYPNCGKGSSFGTLVLPRGEVYAGPSPSRVTTDAQSGDRLLEWDAADYGSSAAPFFAPFMPR